MMSRQSFELGPARNGESTFRAMSALRIYFGVPKCMNKVIMRSGRVNEVLIGTSV